MSKHNKVNPGQYTQAGRLTQDEAARERMKQVDAASTRRMEGKPPSQLKATRSGDAEVDAADDEKADAAADEEQDLEDEQSTDQK